MFTTQNQPRFAVYWLDSDGTWRLKARYGRFANAIVARDTLLNDGIDSYMDVN